LNHEELHERDALGRRRAQEEFDRPVVLEAGAGTGKTATLVARLLAWTLGVGWQRVSERSGPEADDEAIAHALLGGIVAITFTEAAAAEMSTRLGRELSRIARGEVESVIGFERGLLEQLEPAPDDGALAGRARALLSNLDHLSVRTIHAFCRSLLSNYPLESGVHPEFVVDADGSRRRAVLREILQDAILTSYSREAADPVSRLASVGVGPDRLFEALDTLLREGASPELFRRDPFDAEGAAALRTELSDACKQLLETGGESLRGTSKRSKQTATTLTAVDQTLHLLGAPESEEEEASPPLETLFGALRLLWDDRAIKKLGDWKSGRLGTSEAAVFDGDESFHRAARALRSVVRSYAKIDLESFGDARNALRDLLQRSEDELRSAGVATFPGLLAGAHRLLASDKAVLARERGRIDQLLVDEFQDTDPRQCAIVHQLALDGPADRRPGLFIVGDPKQSIYGWREADLEAYEGFLAAIEESGGERHVLTTNFRSTPAILAEVDRVMRPAMSAEAGLQPRYEPLLPHRPDLDTATDMPSIEHWIQWTDFDDGPKGRAEEVAALEAAALARDIERYREKTGAAWSDCAVLYRGRGQLETFQEALRARGIPYAVSRDVGYYRRREVIEAASLVRTILNPTDHLALLTFLRSATVGTPDAALLPLWRRSLPDLATRLSSADDPTLEKLYAIAREVAAEMEGVSESIPGLERVAGWEESLIAAFDLIAHARGAFRELPADHFLEEIRRRSLFEVTEAARHQGEYRIANLERFFRQLEVALADPRRDVEGILYSLRTSVQMQPDAEEAKPQGSEEDSVQLMTIHVAKGLEFRSVWLVQLHVAPPHSDRTVPAAEFDPRDAPDSATPAYALFGWPTPMRHRAEERQRRIEEAERVRTLYVAMTRARERLVLSGVWPTAAAPSHWREARSQIELVAMRDPAPPSMADLWADRVAAGETAWTDEGVRWCFPVLESRSEPAPSRPTVSRDPKTKQWVEEATESLGRIAAAKQREKRPLHAAASSLHGELVWATHEGGSDEREAALLAGTWVHRAFEEWRFEDDPEVELSRARSRALESAAAQAAPVAEAVRRRLDLLFDRLEGGALLDRLQEIGSGWLVRELPLIAPPTTSEPGAPLQALVGSIDLVYRDAAEDRLVIVDFKTDLLEDESEIAARAEAYRPQLEVYRDAIAQAFPEQTRPRCELWFLWTDRVAELD